MPRCLLSQTTKLCFFLQKKLTSEAPCAVGNTTFEFGSERIVKCGNERDVYIETSTNTVTVTITTDKRAGALVDCNAKAISEPKNVEVIELTPNNMFDSITYPKTRDEQEKTWIIKSPKGQNVRLKCDISMYPFSSQWTSGTCANDIFTVQNDGKTTKICGLRPFELTSSTGEIKIRAEIANNTGGRFSCVVDMNVPAEKDENDSSEHGVAPGRKTTTCPCGAANKGDSGGPYVYLDPETNRYTQAGLASYVYGGCTGSYFIGTNTVYWHNWIRNIVKFHYRGFQTSNTGLIISKDIVVDDEQQYLPKKWHWPRREDEKVLSTPTETLRT
ncbi:unnamed protein product [Nesidiocoris tenuis]|uniref:Peptidase S1 domain-containing protein n=1 Tax=Nesidiocoris tenuis TaxID=355587 RepID=A0A6H5GMI8_9HEMI|nr:unnamed protein product [Nesidiocoris tenuis]